MHLLLKCVIGLVVILFCTHISWTIEIPDIAILKEIRAKKSNRNQKILQCLTRGKDITVKWSFNNTEINSTATDSKYKLEQSNSILIINDVKPRDSGDYRCRASNTYGMIFEEIRLKIVGIGEFADGYRNNDMPLTQNVTLGKPYELKCPKHTHLPGQIYTWAVPPLEFWKTGYPIERVFQSDKHGALFFSYVKAEDIRMIDRKGGIACILYNDYSNLVVSTQIKLRSDAKEYTENIEPVVVVPLKAELTAVKGEKKEITCGATGRPHPDFKWYKDGNLISKEDSSESTVDTIYFEGKGIKLIMDPAVATDSGRYKCVASNSEGTVETEGSLTVHSKVTWTKMINQKNFIPVKQPITFECSARGFPDPKYIWYHNNSIISTSSRREIKDGRLHIPVSDFTDCGMYLCTAENMLNTVVSPAYVVIQDVPPVITKGLSNSTYYFLFGQDKSLTCEATGGPEPTITWYKDNKPIVNSKFLTVNGGTLLFKAVTKDQNGVYKCVAKNRKAEVSSSGTVRVYSQTSITKHPDKVRYSAGSAAFLFCEASVDTELKTTWQWLKDGKLIEYNDKVFLKDSKRMDKVVKTHTLQIDELDADGGGIYTCKVFSKDDATFYSGDTSDGSVTVIMAPLPAGNLKITGTFDKGKKVDPKKSDGAVDPTKDPAKSAGAAGPTKKTDPGKSGGAAGPTKKTDPGKSAGAADPTKKTDPAKSGGAADPTKKTDPGKSGGAADPTKKTDPAKSPDAVDPTKTTGPVKSDDAADQSKKADPKISDDVVLSWEKPNEFVGPADKYIIEYAPAGTPANSSKWTQYDPPNKFKDTKVKLDKEKLPASEDLVFRVRAVSKYQGKEMIGEPSEPTEAGKLVTPARAPSAKPLNVRLEMDDKANASAVTWDKLDDTEKPGPGFKVEVAYRENGSNEPFKNSTSDGDQTSAAGPPVSDTGEDKEYEVIVKSKNDAGEGPEQKFILKVPGKKVSEQVISVELVGSTTDGVSIKWQGVAGATGYRIYYTKKDTRRRRRSTETYIDVVENKATVTDLKKGSKYEIQVAAMNLKGPGPRSDPLPVKTKKGVPGVPDGVNIDTYADKVKLSWPTPDDPDIKNYTVTWFPKNDPSQKKKKNVKGDEQQAFITDNLDPDTYYTVELIANSDEGSGDPWVVEGVVVGEGDKPGKPAAPTAVAINTTKINVTFVLPRNNLGGLPNSFELCYGDSEKCLTSEYPGKPSVVFDSLNYRRTYEFYSIAVNDIGPGEKSDIVSKKPLDPPTTTPLPATTAPTTTVNETIPIVIPVERATFRDDKAFYEELWFIILLIILIILIIIAIILCIICNRRGGRYPVGEKERNYGGWDKEALKDYDDDSALENGAGVPLVPPNRSPDRDSIKKSPFQDDVDDDVDSLADYTEGYGDMGQYGSDVKKETNGQTVC